MNVNGKVDKSKLPEPGNKEVKKVTLKIKEGNTGDLEETIFEMF